MSCASRLVTGKPRPSRRALACLLLLLVVYPGGLYPLPQSSKSTGADSYTIRGVVVNSATQAPVPRTLVYASDNRFAKLTDDDGRFEFKIPRPQGSQSPESTVGSFRSGPQPTASTRFIVMARKPGYFDSYFDQVWVDSNTEDPVDLRISLTPEALIVGRVNLPSNDGTDKIQVGVYRRQVQEGTPQWMPAGNVTSRANGDFRFANLQEGDYKLFTEELMDQDLLSLTPGAPHFGYPPVYFPSAGDFESAAIIHLKAGQTFSASLSPSRRQYYGVRINVLSASAQGFAVSVEPQAHPGPGYSLGFNQSENSIQGMLPNGTYTVEVTRYGNDGGSGSLNFSVNGAGVIGPTIALLPNSIVPVTVSDERTKGDNTYAPGPRNLLNALQIRLQSTDEFRHNGPLVMQGSQNPEDDSAQIHNVIPGSYRVRSACNPTGYVAAINSGGTDLLRQPLVVAPGAAVPAVEVTIRDDGAQLEGKVEGWPPPGRSRPASGSVAFGPNAPTVVLLPMPDSTGPFCQSWIGPSGEFNFPQVPPGDYRVLAFDRLPSDLEYQNREAMQPYESKAQELHLSTGQKEQLRLSLTSVSQ